VLGATFFSGIWYGYAHRPAIEKVFNVAGKEPPPQLQDVDFSLFWDVWTRLQEKFVDKSKLDRQKLIYGAITGMVRSTKDPYTDFFSPEVSRQFQDDIRGSFDGIGAEIGLRKGILTIISPLKNSPAERAGLKPGDKVFKINDAITSDLALDEAVRLIRGPKGTDVLLTVVRDGFDKTKEIRVTRDTIRIDSVTTSQNVKLPGSDGKGGGEDTSDIFVLTLNHFNETASAEFRKAVERFYQTGAKKLILDLRNNPGGYLPVSIDIASWFLAPGEVVVRERFADGTEEIHRSKGYRLLENIPMVILVNEGSASASEILAGALRDLKKIKLIGMKTFGKGSVQEVIPLPGDASLKVTVAKWLTPKGIEIDGKGLEPDIKVEPLEEKDSKEKDRRDVMLEKAIEVLQGM
jgi:carboxyl-terminal processing protease